MSVGCGGGGEAVALFGGAAMSVTLPIPLIQALQVVTVAAGAPGVSGVIARVEARLQGRRGPRLLQPYYDLAKLFGKEALAPVGAGPVFLLAPLLSFACYLTVPLLIPVLTSYALPLGYMGDILGGGFILALASFVSGGGGGGDRRAYMRSSGPAGRRRSRRSPSRWCCSSCSPSRW